MQTSSSIRADSTASSISHLPPPPSYYPPYLPVSDWYEIYCHQPQDLFHAAIGLVALRHHCNDTTSCVEPGSQQQDHQDSAMYDVQNDAKDENAMDWTPTANSSATAILGASAPASQCREKTPIPSKSASTSNDSGMGSPKRAVDQVDAEDNFDVIDDADNDSRIGVYSSDLDDSEDEYMPGRDDDDQIPMRTVSGVSNRCKSERKAPVSKDEDEENVPAVRRLASSITPTKANPAASPSSPSTSPSSSPSRPSTRRTPRNQPGPQLQHHTRPVTRSSLGATASTPLVSKSIANRPSVAKEEIQRDLLTIEDDSFMDVTDSLDSTEISATPSNTMNGVSPRLVTTQRQGALKPYKRRRMAFESQVSYRGMLVPGSLPQATSESAAGSSHAGQRASSSSSSSASSSSNTPATSPAPCQTDDTSGSEEDDVKHIASTSSLPSPSPSPLPERMHVKRGWKLARQVWLKHDKRTMMYEAYYVPSVSRVAVVCSHPGCDHLIWDGRAEGDMRRHIRKHLPPLLECPECEHRFTRVDALKRHLLVTEYKVGADEEDERVLRIAKEQEDRARTYWELEKRTYLSVRRARNGAFVARA